MIPLVDFTGELSVDARARDRDRHEEGMEHGVDYTVGTMIELPRACVIADELAKHADFFSFGTNDLTQTTLGLLARRHRRQRSSPLHLRAGSSTSRRSRRSTARASAMLVRMAVERGRASNPASRSGSAASTAATPTRSRSSPSSVSTTCPARRSACRSRASRRRRPPLAHSARTLGVRSLIARWRRRGRAPRRLTSGR